MFKIIGNGAFAKALRTVIISRGGTISDYDYEWIIPCVPSYAIPEVELEQNKKVLLVSKGMIQYKDNGLLPTEWIEKLGMDYAFLSGPHLASELQQNLPTMSSIATQNELYFHELGRYFPSSSHMLNPHFVSLAGVVKNITAYACGMYAAMDYGENARACLVTNGIKELINIASHMKISFNENDITAPGIAADMILTGSSRNSRNFMAGYNRVKGIESQQLTESYHSSVLLIKRVGYSPKYPIISMVASVIDGDLCSSGDMVAAWEDCCKIDVAM